MNFANPNLDFAALMEPVTRLLLGDPNPHHTKPPRDVRYGTNGSVSVNLDTGQFYDHEAKVGGGVIDLIRHKLGLDQAGAISFLRSKGFLPNGSAPRQSWSRQKPAPSAAPSRSPQLSVVPAAPKRIVAEYDYTDENGEPIFQAVRFEPKTFSQRRRHNDGWVWSINAGEVMRRGPGRDWFKFSEVKFANWPEGKERVHLEAARPVLYRLPELLAAIKGGRKIFFVEGEKDADNLREFGLVATTNPMGANKWEPEYTELLRDAAEVIIIGDNDEGGRKHVELVAGSLHGVVKRIRVLDLASAWAECPQKGDISDWIEAGGTYDKFKELVTALPEWQPPDVEALQPDVSSTEPTDDGPPVVDQDRITELAALNPVEYDRQRTAAADELKIRTTTLDKLVAQKRLEISPSAAPD